MFFREIKKEEGKKFKQTGDFEIFRRKKKNDHFLIIYDNFVLIFFLSDIICSVCAKYSKKLLFFSFLKRLLRSVGRSVAVIIVPLFFLSSIQLIYAPINSDFFFPISKTRHIIKKFFFFVNKKKQHRFVLKRRVTRQKK